MLWSKQNEQIRQTKYIRIVLYLLTKQMKIKNHHDCLFKDNRFLNESRNIVSAMVYRWLICSAVRLIGNPKAPYCRDAGGMNQLTSTCPWSCIQRAVSIATKFVCKSFLHNGHELFVLFFSHLAMQTSWKLWKQESMITSSSSQNSSKQMTHSLFNIWLDVLI